MGNENLINLLDALTETSIYVIEEDTHKLLYFNRRCLLTGRGRAAIGVKCHEVWSEVCANCPLQAMGDKDSAHIVCYDPLFKATVDVTANRVVWDGNIRAVVLTAAPHNLNYEKERELRKIERIYAQSLVTVFDECTIANLTDDFYVNCQKNSFWSSIPEQRNFDAQNRAYGKRVLHPDDLPSFCESFSRDAMLRIFGEGKKQISKRLRRLTHDGAYHMMEFSATKIEDCGEDKCWCVLAYRDIQEEFLSEQRLSVEISQLATAAKISYQMLIAVNLTQNSYHMLGYERYPVKKPGDSGCFDDLIAAELATVHPDYRQEFIAKFSRASMTKVFLGGERIVKMEVPHLGEDGIYHWNFTQVVRVVSPHTDDLIEITLSRNIDEDRRVQAEALETERQSKQLLEDALLKAENASLAKSDFLSRMSHDIRTPLNAILGMTELAQLNVGDEVKIRDYLGKISASGAHLLGLINEVLDVSKIESGTVELEEKEFELRELTENATEIVRLQLANKHQTLTLEIDESLTPTVIGDAQRLQQILVNLLENASKYTGEQGKIQLKLKEVKRHDQKVGTYRFEISDNGIGMKPEYLEHVFEPFSRADDSRIAKIGGTGLGMTIVKNLVEMMGGDIRAESKYGKGSRFVVTVCFAKCAEPTVRAPEPNAVPPASFADTRVLLVEDNELNRQIATEMLHLLGVKTEISKNGRDAVEAVLSHTADYYDAVFMDIQMPMMNGYDAAKAIRNSGMAKIDMLPIIAMTADAFAEDVKKARLSGMNGHIAKPISLDGLKTVLSNCLDWKKQNQTNPV